MSSFGCKLQLRNEIMTHDSWFESAEEMVNFLTRYFENDNSNEHFLVDAKIRKQKWGEFKIEPCRKFHIIGANSDGFFGKVLFLRDNNIVSNIFNSNDDEVDEKIENDIDYDVDEYSCEEGFMLNLDTVFELVEPGTFIGMRNQLILSSPSTIPSSKEATAHINSYCWSIYNKCWLKCRLMHEYWRISVHKHCYLIKSYLNSFTFRLIQP